MIAPVPGRSLLDQLAVGPPPSGLRCTSSDDEIRVRLPPPRAVLVLAALLLGATALMLAAVIVTGGRAWPVLSAVAILGWVMFKLRRGVLARHLVLRPGLLMVAGPRFEPEDVIVLDPDVACEVVAASPAPDEDTPGSYAYLRVTPSSPGVMPLGFGGGRSHQELEWVASLIRAVAHTTIAP